MNKKSTTNFGRAKAARNNKNGMMGGARRYASVNDYGGIGCAFGKSDNCIKASCSIRQPK